jgi:hypothetical protein
VPGMEALPDGASFDRLMIGATHGSRAPVGWALCAVQTECLHGQRVRHENSTLTPESAIDKVQLGKR